MVLAGRDVAISEPELRRMCDCTIFGTEAFQAVEAARQLGFAKARKETLTMVQLEKLVNQRLYPVVYIGLMPIDQVGGTHALVVLEMGEGNVAVLDPLVGERQVKQSGFEDAFRLTNGLTILVA